MSQISFADAEYAGKRKKTRREVFLEEMELVVPWKALLKLLEQHYPVAGRGRRPYPLESMLRVHLMQNWFALSDPAKGPAPEARQHRGCHHHCRAQLDQEQQRRARPRDAPDQEGQPVALRHEGPHCGGC